MTSVGGENNGGFNIGDYTPAQAPRKSILSKARFYYYLPIAYTKMIGFALRRGLRSSGDIKVIAFLLVTPLLFFTRFKGRLKCPFGIVLVQSRDKVRSLAYGIFKTHFSYLPVIRTFKIRWSFSTVVDIGANVGDFVLALPRETNKIIAIEPGERNFSSLKLNINANGLPNIVALKVAAHDKSERVSLEGIDSMLHVVEQGNGETAIGIPMDNVFSNTDTDVIDLLKVDVQGHELKVLRGMAKTLRQQLVKLLVVEGHPIRGVGQDQISSLMGSYGYKVVRIDHYLFGQPHLYFRPNGGAEDTHPDSLSNVD